MPEPTIYPVGYTFRDSAGIERIKTRWEFNAFVTQEGARASLRGIARHGTEWFIWRLADGSYDYSATEDPALLGHPAELVERVTVR